MVAILVLFPVVAALIAFLLKANALRRGLLVGAASLHLALVLSSWVWGAEPALGGWLELDASGRLFLTITSTLFLAASVQAVSYLQAEAHEHGPESTSTGFAFTKVPEAVFTGCMLLFISTMTFVTVCQHFGLMWVAVEATTLTSAPLWHSR